MKLHAHIAAAIVGLLTLVGGSAVKAASPELRALVPFAFSAGNKTLDAGSYSIERTSGTRGLVTMRSQRGGVIFLAQPGEPADGRKIDATGVPPLWQSVLPRQVWFDATSGYGLPETREEGESAARARARALGHSVVTVVAALG